MSKQQQQQFNSFNLGKLGFFAGSLVVQKEGTKKPHRVQVTISVTFN